MLRKARHTLPWEGFIPVWAQKAEIRQQKFGKLLLLIFLLFEGCAQMAVLCTERAQNEVLVKL